MGYWSNGRFILGVRVLHWSAWARVMVRAPHSGGLVWSDSVRFRRETKSFGFGGAAPDSEWFTGRDGVIAAFTLDGARSTNLFGAPFTPDPGTLVLAISGKEQIAVHVSALGIELPFPEAIEWRREPHGEPCHRCGAFR
jgi:hypothetical protein